MNPTITPPIEQLPTEYVAFKGLMEAALRSWVPDSDCIWKPMSGGASGSAVLRVDIAPNKDPEDLDGQYILKLSLPPKWDDQPFETEAHQRAVRYSDLSSKHIPALQRQYPPAGADRSPQGYAMLYSIAGGSLDRYQTAEIKESAGLLEIAEMLAHTLLIAWVEPTVGQVARPCDLMAKWTGYRLDPNQAAPLHAFVNRWCEEKPYFVVAGETLLNPLYFCTELSRRQAEARRMVHGLLHNDLHGGNLLFFARQPAGQPFQVIDFGLSKPGPIGFDHAYLELWGLLRTLGDRDPSPTLRVLRRKDWPERKEPLPDGTHWVSGFIDALRAGVEHWKTQRMAHRADDVDRQFCLARVAAGINWANKSIDDRLRFIALCYAGWAARLYVERFEPNQLGHLTAGCVTIEASTKMENMEKMWKILFETIGHFSNRSGRYVLVSEGLRHQPHASALGNVPWSAVIDLDPDSETEGLHNAAAPILKCHRGVHLTFDSDAPAANVERGCIWLGVGGRRKEKKLPTPLDQWVFKILPKIQSLLQRLHQETTPTPLFIMVLPGASLDPQAPMERLTRIADSALMASKGDAQVIVLGYRDIHSRLPHQHVPLPVAEFTQHLHALYGDSTAQLEAAVPGATGWCTIALDKLRTMQEHLILLHSRVLDDIPETSPQASSDFWRGNPPTLSDLASDVDLSRNITAKLKADVKDQLDNHSTYTVLFNHQPGAGGTTAAMRVAWDLRGEFPTAIIRKWSPAVVDRVNDLFLLSGKPILLVGQAPGLSESDREDLHLGLRHLNCRAVLLYLRRTFSDPGPEGLSQQMSEDEAQRFAKAYKAFTTDSRRRSDIEKITTNKALMQYRSPFFYGLITFERDYAGIESYVEKHLLGLRERPRNLLKYIALCTVYSNGGIPEDVCKRMQGHAADAKLSVEALLGAGPARLIISRSGQWRILHQVLAEEVLAKLVAADWRFDLVALAEDFIRTLSDCTDSESEQVNAMLREMFVDRMDSGTDSEDRGEFAPLITEVCDNSGVPSNGKLILTTLTEKYPHNPHFWNHLGRFQVHRMRSGLQEAEEALLKAVSLSPKDRIHHHTLGVVRRARVYEILQSRRNYSPKALLSTIGPHFEGATKAFMEARELAPEDTYGYLSHIEMIIAVGTKLKRLLGIESIGEVSEAEPEVIEWIAEQIALAESLLNSAKRLYGNLEKGRELLNRCEANLSRLYGDFDSVIRIWEIAESRGRSTQRSRRALANAFLARSERQWRKLSQAELARIAHLMERNMSGASRVADDYRLWFEASMLQPTFDIDRAIANLTAWSQRYTSWQAHYYLYVLHFIEWFKGGGGQCLALMEESLEKCEQNVVGRKHFSEQWVANYPQRCPIVSSLDLGEWNKKLGFWPNVTLLRRINGIITKIDGAQAGTITIEGRLKIFFVPSTKPAEEAQKPLALRRHLFSANTDENTPVNFFLGFSPVGLRAWIVHPGHVDGGDRAVLPSFDEATRPILLPDPELSSSAIEARMQSMDTAMVMRFIYDIAKAYRDLSAPLSLRELRSRVDAAFGVDNLFNQDRVHLKELERVLLQTKDYEILEESGERFLRLKPEEANRDTGTNERPQRQVQREVGVITWFDRYKQHGGILCGNGETYRFHCKYMESSSREDILSWQSFFLGRAVSFVIADIPHTAYGVRLLSPELTLHQGVLLTPVELGPVLASVILTAAEKAGEMGDRLSTRKLFMRIDKEFPGGQPIVKRLRCSDFNAYLRTVPGIQLDEHGQESFIVLGQVAPFGKIPNQRPQPAQQRPSQQARISNWDSRNAHARQGRTGVHIKEPVQSAVTARSVNHQRTAAVGTAVNREISLERAKEVILLVIAEAAGRGKLDLSLTDVGSQCRKIVISEGEFPKKPSLAQLIRSIPEVELHGFGAAWRVRMRNSGRD